MCVCACVRACVCVCEREREREGEREGGRERERERESCLLGDIFTIDDYIYGFVKLHVNGFCLSVMSCFYSAMSLI